MVRVVRATPVELATAVQALRDGEPVAFPTETVYGLGAHAGYPAALRRVFELKGRPTTHPLIVHIDNARYLTRWAREVPEAAARLPSASGPDR
jgi:L-threonylcarbamoyladenylate synthase